jgi:hypothetical protein
LAPAFTKKVANQSKGNKSATVAANIAVEKKVAPANKSLTNTRAKKWNAPGVARRTVERKKVPSHSSGVTAKSAGYTGGKKPSPAIAKTQASQEPSD